jgi:transcriptional regulator with XRE-family HTH domain
MADLTAQYRIILEEEYRCRSEQNSRYSRNAFARLLGIDNTYLSKLTRGKILLSLDIAERITKRLKLDPKTRAEFLMSAAEEQRCHALYLIDPSLTECDPNTRELNLQPASRKKAR